MNNDLISRSAVIAIIEKKRLMVGKHDLSAEYKLAGVQEEIENLPIAYDVDKVVERLMCESINCHIMTDRAVEIVKSGAIE